VVQSGSSSRLGTPAVTRQPRQIAPKFVLSDSDADSEVFCVRFSPDDQYLAAACGTGAILVYNALTGKRAFLLNAGREDKLPTTQLRWRPPQSLSKTKNVLVCVAADGRVTHWHASSGKLLHEIVEPDNQLFCVDYVANGSQFATAGKRREIRIYDEYTKKLAQVLSGGDSVNTPGHSNRVFSLKYHPSQRDMLVTGGWDNTVQFWDLRRGHAVRAIFGPHVCGDAVDLSSDGNTLLTGSWRTDRQLQLWDFRSERLLDTIPWRTGVSMAQPCMVYAAQFSKDEGSTIIAAGNVTGLTRACYSVDFSSCGSMLAVSGGDGCVRVMGIHSPSSSHEE